MDFRKIFFVFALLIFGNWNFAQTDSTDLNAFFRAPSEMTLEDSMLYFGTDMQEVVLSFELTDTILDLGTVWIELIHTAEGVGPSLLSNQSFTPQQLLEQGLIDTNVVTIVFRYYSPGEGDYIISMWFEDTDGRNIKWITKMVQE